MKTEKSIEGINDARAEINMKVTENLAFFVSSFDNKVLPSVVVNQVRRVLIDYYCAAITGSQTDTSKMILEYLIENEGEGEIKVIGSEKYLSKTNSAFINGTSAHCLDFDDGHTYGSMHPGSVVIPAVLAVSQAINAKPEKIMNAIVIGYEISLRLATAIHPASRQRGFHNTPVAGIFGATAAISYLYDLSMNQIQNAFGIAGSFCGGTFAFLGSGSEVKRIHPGQAAQDGIKAAELARAGLTGPDSFFETENGFFQAFAGGIINYEKLIKESDTQFEIMNIYFKPYPCCRHLHVAIDCVRNIKAKCEIDVNKIEKVLVGVNKIASLHNHKKCTSLLDAQMSLPYSVSVALLNHEINVDLFEPKNAEESVWNLCDKIEIYVDEEADAGYPSKRASKVEIVMTDGQRISDFLDNPSGEPSKPLSDEQLETKFLKNCSLIIGTRKAQRFLELMTTLEYDEKFLYDI